MEVHYLLCDKSLPAPTVTAAVPLQEDPDAICPSCRALSGPERRALRELAMARLMREETD